MKRIVRILGLVIVLTALLVVSITGAVFAAGDENGEGKFQNQPEVCPCEGCPCGECEPDPIGTGPHGKHWVE